VRECACRNRYKQVLGPSAHSRMVLVGEINIALQKQGVTWDVLLSIIDSKSGDL
jgi:hypothetical protein